MKKFILGLVCGTVLFSSSFVCAGSLISVIEFPSYIQFHLKGGTTELKDLENPVLNYDNRTYIPLRTFAETMGATVNFQGPSAITNYQNQIDIYTNSNAPEKSYSLQDPEGYVSIGDLQYNTVENGKLELAGGTIRINKALDGKIINLFHVYDPPSPYEGFSPILILNETIDPLKPGDIRPFRVPFGGEPFKIPEFKVLVKEPLQPIQLSRGSNIPSMPLFFEAGTSGTTGNLDNYKNSPILFQYHLVNLGADCIVQPVSVEFQIFKQDSSGNLSAAIYTTKLPAIGGMFKKTWGLQGIVSWDKRDSSGHLVEPGTYYYKFILPERSFYQFQENGTINTCEIKAPLGGAENSFEIK